MGLTKVVAAWLRADRAASRIDKANCHLDELAVRAAALSAGLDVREAELRDWEDRLARDLQNARTIHRKLESALEEAREKNRVLETTIQTLVAQHKLILERIDAETAIAVRTKVAASGPRE